MSILAGKRVFVMHTENFHVAIVRELIARGASVPLVCASTMSGRLHAYHELLPDAVRISTFDAQGARLPPPWDRALPPSERELVELAAVEADVLQMMDRLNHDAWPIFRLRNIYLRYVAQWQALIEKLRPDVLLYQATPHMGFDAVAYELARRRGIPTAIVDRTYLDEVVLMLRAVDEIPGPSAEEVRARAATLPTEGDGPPRGSLDALNEHFNDVDDIRRRLSVTGIGRTIVNRRLLDQMRERLESPVHSLSGKRPRALAYRFSEALGHAEAREAFDEYNRIARPIDPGVPHVFLPLHFQPERSTLPGGGRLGDQLHVVELLARALPPGTRLLVKEHPRQFRRGILWPKARHAGVYRELAAIPSVELVPLSTRSSGIIEGAFAVATISGTAGWEAVQMGRPAVVFGHPWYERSPGVRRVTSVAETADALVGALSGDWRVDPRMTRAYQQLLVERHAFRGAFSDKLLSMSKMSVDENARGYADALDRMLHA